MRSEFSFSSVSFLLVAMLLMQPACGSGKTGNTEHSAHAAPVAGASRPSAAVAALAQAAPLPGMPPVLDPENIYAADSAGNLSPEVRNFRPLVYVPNSGSNTVDVIDPKTYKIVDHFRVGRQPQHVTPSYDLKKLWVLNDLGDSITEIDPASGKKGKTIRVEDPYNMYYTPDGKYAIVVAERLHRLDFRDPQTMKLVHSTPVPCRGVDHMDFSANGRYLVASCEFSAAVVAVDVAEKKVVAELSLAPGGMPQDVKLSPDGKIFYVADMAANVVTRSTAATLQLPVRFPRARAYMAFTSAGMAGCSTRPIARRAAFR